MRFWMDLGADGFRADMASSMVKGRDVNRDTLGYWREVRKILDENYPEAFTVAEWSDPEGALDGAFHAGFYHWAEGFNDLYQKESWRIGNGMSEGHSFFDREGKGDVTRFLKRYLPPYQATRAKGYVCLPLGNHDIARLNNNRSTDENELLMAWGLTMPGVPFVYYGTEIGMRQLHDLPQIEGAFTPRAGARTPMQWAPDLPAGRPRRRCAHRGGGGAGRQLAPAPRAKTHPAETHRARAGRLCGVRAALRRGQHVSVHLCPGQRRQRGAGRAEPVGPGGFGDVRFHGRAPGL